MFENISNYMKIYNHRNAYKLLKAFYIIRLYQLKHHLCVLKIFFILLCFYFYKKKYKFSEITKVLGEYREFDIKI